MWINARSIFRLLDGLPICASGFLPDADSRADIRTQRRALLASREGLNTAELAEGFSKHRLFSNDTFACFIERSGHLWSVLHLKFSEYLSPVFGVAGHRPECGPQGCGKPHSVVPQKRSVSLRIKPEGGGTMPGNGRVQRMDGTGRPSKQCPGSKALLSPESILRICSCDRQTSLKAIALQ